MAKYNFHFTTGIGRGGFRAYMLLLNGGSHDSWSMTNTLKSEALQKAQKRVDDYKRVFGEAEVVYTTKYDTKKK